MPKTLRLKHPDIKDNPKTSFTTFVGTGSSSATVANTQHMISDEYVIIGGYGTPVAELLLTGTISTDTSLPFATNTLFNHSSGEIVQHIFYNQIEIDYSSNLETLWESGAYATLYDAMSAATWSNLTTTSIKVSQEYTTYHDTASGRSYRARYKNSDETAYSDYFFIQLPDGFEEKSVDSIIRKAVEISNQKLTGGDSGQINTQFCLDSINEGLRFLDSERKRWSHNQSFEGVISEITAGKYIQYSLLSNIDVRNSRKSIWNLRIADGKNLTWIDKSAMDAKKQDMHQTTSTGSLTSGSTTLTVTDSSDFADSGTFDVWTGTTHDTVEYSANNRTTNTLTLVSASTDVTTTHASGSYIWQNATFGVPNYWTIYNGYIVFDVVPDETLHQRNIEADYYLKTQQVVNMYDYVRIQDPNFLIYFLRMNIALKTNNKDRFTINQSLMLKSLDNMKKNESSGQTKRLQPNSWQYRTDYSSR